MNKMMMDSDAEAYYSASSSVSALNALIQQMQLSSLPIAFDCNTSKEKRKKTINERKEKGNNTDAAIIHSFSSAVTVPPSSLFSSLASSSILPAFPSTDAEYYLYCIQHVN